MFGVQAPWSPRAGMGLLNQPYTGTLAAQTERIVLLGGYGGWLSTDERFDGIRCQSDVWVTLDMKNWTRIAETTEVGGVAWFGFTVWNIDASKPDHTMWIVGGGYIGDEGNRKVTTMQGSVDSYYSTDAITWTRTNYKIGGGTSPLEQYSSNEWTTTIIDGNLMFLGLWGLTLETFLIQVVDCRWLVVFGVQREVMCIANPISILLQGGGEAHPSMYMIGGDQDGTGTLRDAVYRSSNGLLCDIDGVVCGGL